MLFFLLLLFHAFGATKKKKKRTERELLLSKQIVMAMKVGEIVKVNKPRKPPNTFSPIEHMN